jgi:DNA polymerase-3 subunit beta
MKIRVHKSVLESALINSSSFVEKKDFSLITSHILLEAKDNKLVIKATDYEIGIMSKINTIETKEDGVATANGKKLVDIIKALKNDELIIETNEDNLHIKQKNSQYKLPMFRAEEFPNFPSPENMQKIEVVGDKFISSIKKALPTIETNNHKYELNGALLDIKNQTVRLVGTDTKRMSISVICDTNNEDTSLIIPEKSINEIQKLFSENLEIMFEKTNLVIKNEDTLFFTRLINGKYPDYHRIVPVDANYTIKLPKDAMIEAIKQINIVSNEIKISIIDNIVKFESLSDENLEAETKIEIEDSQEIDIAFGINSKYLLDFLQSLDEKEFKMDYKDPSKAIKMYSNNFTTIVMPIIM